MDGTAAFIFVPLAIGLRIFADRLDRGRIRDHIAQRGGEVLDIEWNPFGKGCFGSAHERIYEVTYRTHSGRQIKATCKTSLLSGVYWTSDAVPGDIHDPAASQEAIPCPSCGYTIPATRSRCPRCGWSYKDR